ncbi:MAG: hypothetical protein AAF004_01040 [Pseudomonadota bacterium]
MKLRVLNNTLRFRLSQSEVVRFIAGQRIQSSVVFPGSGVLHYSIVANVDNAPATALFDQDGIAIVMPGEAVATFADDDVITIDASIGSDDRSLVIKIEKDFQCLVPRGEDESDLYVHPRSNVC